MRYRDSIAPIALLAVVLGTVSAARAFDESLYPDWSAQWRLVPDSADPLIMLRQ